MSAPLRDVSRMSYEQLVDAVFGDTVPDSFREHMYGLLGSVDRAVAKQREAMRRTDSPFKAPTSLESEPQPGEALPSAPTGSAEVPRSVGTGPRPSGSENVRAGRIYETPCPDNLVRFPLERRFPGVWFA